jgi:hypothetical protein
VIRALSCSVRGRFACPLIFPKFDEVIFVGGAEKITEFGAFSASACSANLMLS